MLPNTENTPATTNQIFVEDEAIKEGRYRSGMDESEERVIDREEGQSPPGKDENDDKEPERMADSQARKYH